MRHVRRSHSISREESVNILNFYFYDELLRGKSNFLVHPFTNYFREGLRYHVESIPKYWYVALQQFLTYQKTLIVFWTLSIILHVICQMSLIKFHVICHMSSDKWQTKERCYLSHAIFEVSPQKCHVCRHMWSWLIIPNTTTQKVLRNWKPFTTIRSPTDKVWLGFDNERTYFKILMAFRFANYSHSFSSNE